MSNDIVDFNLIADIRNDTNKWPDTARRLVYTKTGTDKAGKPVYSYVPDNDTFTCRFRPITPDEVEVAGEQEVMMGQLHCPRGTVLYARDRIRLTHKWRDALSQSKDYELMGDPSTNGAELTVIVKRATGTYA